MDEILYLAKMDGTQNDSAVDAITFEGFPTMFYIKAGSDKPESYGGPREAKGIWNWLRENNSNQEVMKKKAGEDDGKDLEDKP